MAKVRILNGDDWMELYVDGAFVGSGHSIRTGDLLKAIGVDYEIVFGEWKYGVSWKTDSAERNGRSLKTDELAEIAKELDGSHPR
jgi:hypothetical protein